MVSRGDEEHLLQEGDPLRDGESLATRKLAIDEVDRIKTVLHEAGIAYRVRLLAEDPPAPPSLFTRLRRSRAKEEPPGGEYSVTEPSWNVIVPRADAARARALVERELRSDVDGSAETEARASGEPDLPTPVVLCVLRWEAAWKAVERLQEGGIKAALGEGLGDGPIEGRDYPVLVLPDDVAKARAWMPELPVPEDP
jgi:hypothetical protein